MARVTPGSGILGATIDGLDLAEPLAVEAVELIAQALGRYGVIRFPDQSLSSADLRAFSARFGDLEINVANAYQEAGIPEVMILSNITREAKPIGLADAGQDWHTDMSYNKVVAFANVLYGIEIPRRAGQALGATEFSNMHAAYEDLPAAIKERLAGMTALHDFGKFWDRMRREKGSARPPLTDAQRAARPPVSQPLFPTHPITGRKVLYANPGYAVRINELPSGEGDAMLNVLFEHQLREKYRYVFRWTAGDVLMWDDIGTIHQAAADYGLDERRLVKRCQVMATRFGPIQAWGAA